MSNIWYGQRVVYHGQTGTVLNAYYQGNILGDGDTLMLDVVMDETNKLFLLNVDDVTIVGLEEIENG